MEMRGLHLRKHGLSKLPEYRKWAAMRNRCINPVEKHHHGKGVVVCSRWDDFTKFYEDVGPMPGPGYSVDRWPDPAGDYRPGNVRWSTVKEQNRNKDCVILNEEKAAEIRALRGVLFQREIAEKFGISRGMVGHIQRGKAWV